MEDEVPYGSQRPTDTTGDIYEGERIAATNPILPPRPVDHKPIEDISGLVPANTGYINGGSSINYRPPLAPPREMGDFVGEVEFDTKCNDVYSNPNEARHTNLNLLNSQSADHATYKEMSKPSNQKWCFYIQVVFIVVTLALQLFLLVLGCFTFLRTESIISSPSPSTDSSPSQITIQELSRDFDELKLQLATLRNNSNACASGHNATLDIISAELDILSKTVDNLNDSLTPSTDPVEISSICTTVERKCQTNETVSPSLNFSSCITPRFLQSEVDSSNYITNLQCSVDVDYVIIAPVGSTLVVEDEASDDAWLCRCMGIKVVHPHLDPVGSFNCTLQITMCPKTIHFP